MTISLDMTYLTALTGLIGVLLGTLINPRVNHRLGVKSNRQEIIFRRKLEYFEKIAETVEKNKRMYHNEIYRIENSKDKKEIRKIVAELKQKRNNFMIFASPLYFNTESLSRKIRNFVEIEKSIFNQISRWENEKDIISLKEKIRQLNVHGSEIVYEMKKELSR